jgi:hypothetical protein
MGEISGQETKIEVGEEHKERSETSRSCRA